uniref:Carbonic anhydrase n=1 Tax=Gouania willdenowi TaxID=441366 RepID=A0A8C5HN31_GOUWI
DPSHWAALFPSCGGLRQSPINIVSSKVHVNSALPPFDFIGHTNTLNITSVRLTGGALPGHYRASQFHFHWGGNGNPGSEHTIDGERFPMELHIVHIKEPYGTLAEAEHDLAGIALLGFLFEVMKRRLFITIQTSAVMMMMFSPQEELHNYYRYVGSITTPGCEQAVTWTLFHKTLAISSRQVRKPEFLKKPEIDNFYKSQGLKNEFPIQGPHYQRLCLYLEQRPIQTLT